MDEHRYQSLIKATSAFVWRCAPDGSIVEIDDEWLSLVGLTSEEALGWQWIVAVHELDREAHLAAWRHAIECGSIFEFEYRLCCCDGSVRWFADRMAPVRDDDGILVEWIGAGHDISERKEAEEELGRQRETYRSLVESTSAILWQGDPETFEFTFVSPNAETLLGYPVERWLDEPEFWLRHIHPADRDWVPAYCAAATAELRQHSFDYRMIAADGRTVWLRDVVSILADHGRPAKLVGVMVDITSTKETELELEYVSGLQQILVETSEQLIGACATDMDEVLNTVLARIGIHCGLDRCYLAHLGDSGNRLRGTTHEWSAPDAPVAGERIRDWPRSAAPLLVETLERRQVLRIASRADLGPEWEAEQRLLGDQQIRSLVVVPIVVDDTVESYVGVDVAHDDREWSDEEIRLFRGLADIIGACLQRNRAEARLHETQALVEMAGRTARFGGWRADLVEGRMISSEACRAIRDLPAGQDLLVEDALESYADGSREIVRRKFTACARDGVPYDEELEIITATGRRVSVREIGEPVRDANGFIVAVRGSFQDITKQKSAQAEVEFLALYDPLTRLPNRRLLLDRLQHALAASQRNGFRGAVLFLDLDQFKTLNDTLGHDVGDRLLHEVAGRLQRCLQSSDTIARFGGDEFVVILNELAGAGDGRIEQAERAGERICAALTEPYVLGEHERYVTASIGITMFDGADDTADDVMKRADLAMYQAKDAGRNTWRVFDPAMRIAVHSRVAVESALREGLKRGEIVPYYQPVIDAAGRVTGAEALARWENPDRGLVFPGEFISVAEDTGLILPLGEAMLEAVCAQLAAWAQRPPTAELNISVNISARQFHHPEFTGRVLRIIEETGADPAKLWLELTESLLLVDVDDTITRMEALKAWGIRFSLDDFGTGYSSLAYLKRLPLDLLKIDQSFVRDALTDTNDEAIMRTIILLAHTMGMDVLAEGVETEEVRRLLASHGCKQYQGYLFGAAIPAEQFEARVNPAAMSL